MTDSFCLCTLTNLCVRSNECLTAVAPLEDTHLHILEQETYEEAIQHSRWQLAMDKEIQALHANDTWEVVTLLAGNKPIACK